MHLEPPEPHELQIWIAALDLEDAAIVYLNTLLSAEERVRAERYRFGIHRRRFIAARGSLRLILGGATSKEPAAVEFTYGEHGKPDTPGEIRFNLSDSHDLAVIALTHGREVGVDIERLRPMPRADRLARRFFSPREAAHLDAIDGSRRDDVFFSCWTRKEAWIKAVGGGLSIPLDQFEVSVLPEEPARLVHVDGNDGERDRWSMHAFRPGSRYVGAVAIEGSTPLISIHQVSIADPG